MSCKFAAYAISAWIVSYPSVGSSQPTLENLMKQCAQKTIVMGYDEGSQPVKVGENIDGYFSGFFDGALTMLLRSGAICIKDTAPAPEFLLSVVETYYANGGKAGKDVGSLIETAFKRAFRCTPVRTAE